MKWLKQHFTRKWTVGIHVIAGAFCGVLYHWYAGLAVLMFAALGWFEWWEGEVRADDGHLDFWDTVFGLFLGAAIVFLLNLKGVI